MCLPAGHVWAVLILVIYFWMCSFLCQVFIGLVHSSSWAGTSQRHVLPNERTRFVPNRDSAPPLVLFHPVCLLHVCGHFLWAAVISGLIKCFLLSVDWLQWSCSPGISGGLGSDLTFLNFLNYAVWNKDLSFKEKYRLTEQNLMFATDLPWVSHTAELPNLDPGVGSFGVGG